MASPVLHIALSLAPGEQLDRGRLMDMVGECARSMGFEKNQYVAVQHIDTGHQHLHIVANRVGFDGKTVSDSCNYRRMAAFAGKWSGSMTSGRCSAPGNSFRRLKGICPARINGKKR